MPSKFVYNILWDLFCSSSIIGIWPRFIEPKLIFTTRLTFKIPGLPQDLEGFKIVQISDLHLHRKVPDAFLEKIRYKISKLKPDLIVFTGDFLCYSMLKDSERLHKLLCSLKAPYGCYAILGNHDYAECVSINENGEYDIIDTSSSSLAKGFKRLLTTISLRQIINERAKKVPLHTQLLELLSKTPFKLLHNSSDTISVKNSKINICGLGEYMLGRLNLKETFKNYNPQFPGIILLHNPDGVPFLKNFPGDIILCGHTHGGQINLPWLWRKFTLLENMQYKKGLSKVDNKWVYVNRGLGSAIPFRWFSPPEILLLTLSKQP